MPVSELATRLRTPTPSPESLEVSLRALRSLLEAAASFDLAIEGSPVRVEVTGATTESGSLQPPVQVLVGGDPARLPAPVLLRCRWKGGHVDFVLSVRWESGSQPEEQELCLSLRAVQQARQVLSVGVSYRFESITSAVVPIVAWANAARRQGEDGAQVIASVGLPVRVAVGRSGLPLVSPTQVRLFEIDRSTGELLPSAQAAFQNLVHLGLLKLPVSLRGVDDASVGAWPYDLAEMLAHAEPGLRAASEVRAASSRRLKGGLGTLPGGVAKYKTTLDALLNELSQHPMTEEGFRDHLRERYNIHGEAAWHTYGSVLENLDLVTWRDERLELSPRGVAYLRDPTPLALFQRLHETFTGFLATLVVIDSGGSTTASTLQRLRYLLGTSWQGAEQSNRRRNWLLSLGATERSEARDSLTEFGRVLLAEYAEEADILRGELDGLKYQAETTGTSDGHAAEMALRPEPAGIDGAGALNSPAGWQSDRVELTADHAKRYLNGLQLPELLLEQACAALSAGKHLLLVGPPGTGKTELAHVLSAAAAAEEYCAGAFVTTASADWTTFETIGGYALQSDRSLAFRPGAFLQALELRQWLVIDEFNRADVDRAFGELMTVLAGRSTKTTLVGNDGKPVSIGAEPGCSHQVFGAFRVIATMNTWDKTSLFRLSHAVQRRFAVLHVGLPDDPVYAGLLTARATQAGPDQPLPERDVQQLLWLFSSQGLLAHRQIGPAVALDLVKYLRRRQAGGDGMAEAIEMFLFPQLEGLEQEAAFGCLAVLRQLLAGYASSVSRERLVRRYGELFPHLAFPKA